MLSPWRIARRLRHWFTTPRRDAELNEELQAHIELEAEKYVRAGLAADAARARAVREFGGVARFRDETRDAHGIRPLEDFTHDLRIGLRGLLRHRAFAAVAILTLAIGIGGTTAVFGAVYGVLLAPLPYREQDRVVTIWQTDTRNATERDEVAVPNFIDWRDRSRSFTHMALAEPFSLDYIGPDGPEVFRNAVVTAGFFEALGVTPMLGRTFTDEEYTPGRNQAVILSERLWRTRFGGDTSMVGKVLLLDGSPMRVAGVLPAAVDVPWNVQAWTPKVFRPDELVARRAVFYAVVARLRDGVTLEAAQSEMTGIASAVARENPATNEFVGAAVVPIADALLGDARKGLFILLGAVAFVLLIACVNVASLQLARAVRRRRELATRAALGAGTWRLSRQMLAESLLLGIAGGALGLALAHGGLAGIRALAPADLPRIEDLRLQPAVLMFATAVTLLTSLLFGLAPVMEARRLHLAEAITSGGRATSGTRARRRTQNTLVVAEVALALVLLVGAGLLIRSFRALISVDRGFQTDNVLVATVQAWSHYQTPDARTAFVRDALARMQAIPGVRAAGMTSALPLNVPIGAERGGASIEGQPPAADGQFPTVRITAVTPGYFDALRTPLRAGRMLDDTDRATTAPVVLVNEAFAKRYWPDGNALGKRVGIGFQRVNAIREVVGIVADVRHEGLDRDPEPTIFAPHAQAPTGAIHFTLRTTEDPRAIERAVRTTLASLSGTMPVSAVTTLDALLDSSLRDRRFHLALLGTFSAMALLLSAIGMYGLLSQMTGERTQEIGVRMAIGATTGQVMRMVVRQGTMLAAVGIAIGFVGALGLTRLLRGMLFNVTPIDPAAYAAALGILLAVAIVACWIPARRAAAVDPVAALRDG